MRKWLAAVIVLLLGLTACGRAEPPAPTPPPPPVLSAEDLAGAVLDSDDVGEGWERRENPAPNTVQIGGRVGAANVRPSLADATSAFSEEEGSGFVSNTLFLLQTEEMSRAVIAAHEQAVEAETWTQDRDDGGTTAFRFSGMVEGLPSLGDEMFAAALAATVTDPAGAQSELRLDYVVYRVGHLVAFVVTQDVDAQVFARRQEAKVTGLLTR